ncbi:hypothetical protein GIB67_015806 [Kingdonia uniflora]|uniref:Uncharacterized protein n=1 Tax=Kingdonia uniflora TaxID=39325 RepID=A0A7J7NV70_9MAGN|nr:hypothetical protein GIB67_015806 [Kingdonia uniflora]
MDIGRKNIFKNEGSCNDGNVVLLKWYKASDMESRKDASVLESRTVCARSNKCHPLEREKINSTFSSPIKHFTTSKNLESTQRERQKIRGFDKELSEGNKRLKRAKDYGSRRWLYDSVVRGKLDSTVDSHSYTEEYGLSLPLTNLAKGIMNAIGTYPIQLNGNMWELIVKNVVIAGVKSTVERKESLLDKVAEEETELELVLKGLGLSRKKKVDSRSNKVRKAQSTRSMAGVDEGKRQVTGEEARTNLSKTPGTGSLAQPNPVTSSKLAQKYLKKRMLKAPPAYVPLEVVARLVKGIWLGIWEEKSELKKLQVETKANLDEMVKERDKLGHHLMLKGYSEEEVDAIKADTYVVEEDEEEAEAMGIVDGLDGVSRQTMLDNHGDDVELSEGGSEKVELDSSRSREDDVLMCNREFAGQFDMMKEANKNREDQYVKEHFRLGELTQAVSDLTLQVEEKDSEIKKG